MKKSLVWLAVLSLIAAVLLSGCGSQSAQNKPFEYTLIRDGAAVCITKYVGNDAEVTIPDTLDDKPVTEIGADAFLQAVSVTRVTVPAGVTTIGDRAFELCSSLTRITLSEGLTKIGEAAFSQCASLTGIAIPSTVTEIGESVLLGCSSLESIKVVNGNAKYHSDGNCLIETYTHTLLAGCRESVIPADGTVTAIGKQAFNGCSLLESIEIPDGVTRIGWAAFQGCSSLKSVTIPDSVTAIDGLTFHTCIVLESIDIPAGVTEIPKGMFSHCFSLTSVTVPDGVTVIDQNAFHTCTALTDVTIPASVTEIADGAFYHCNALQTVHYGGTEADRAKIQIGSEENGALLDAAWEYAA